MHDLTAKRTLVKSPPELWSELSEVDRLARHLDAFGEIKITKLEPEHTVAWEGEGASGTVSLEPSGWGTKVTLTAQVEEARADASTIEPPIAQEPASEAAVPEPARLEPDEAVMEGPEPSPAPSPEPELARPPGFFARLFRRRFAPPVEAPVVGAPVVEAPVVGEPIVGAEPVVEEPIADEPAPIVEESAPEPVSEDRADPETRDLQAVLDDVLEALGSAHHRPFSRG
jgi:hypothetical protein